MTEKVQKDHRGRPRKLYQTVNLEPSLTVQSDAPQADIRQILKKYDALGIVDHLNLTEASFQDVTAFTDYADVFRTAKSAESEFMKLPSKVREAFDHDVANWLDTAHDPEKRALLREKGILPPDESATPPTPDPQPKPPPATESSAPPPA